jgi:hypothetical protein
MGEQAMTATDKTVYIAIAEEPSKDGSGQQQCRAYSPERREEFLDEFSRLTKRKPKLWVTIWAIDIDEDAPWFFDKEPAQKPLGMAV